RASRARGSVPSRAASTSPQRVEWNRVGRGPASCPLKLVSPSGNPWDVAPRGRDDGPGNAPGTRRIARAPGPRLNGHSAGPRGTLAAGRAVAYSATVAPVSPAAAAPPRPTSVEPDLWPTETALPQWSGSPPALVFARLAGPAAPRRR